MTTKYLIFLIFLCFLTGCHEGELLDDGEQPWVVYSITITDEATGKPIEAVEVKLKTIFDKTFDYKSDEDGRVKTREFESGTNEFTFIKKGYQTLDSLDEVSFNADSLFGQTLRRDFKVKMKRIPMVKYNLLLSDSVTGQPLSGVTISITRSDLQQSQYKTDSNGQLVLDPIQSSRTLISTHPKGYLPLDTIDEVAEGRDSIFDLPITRTMHLKLVRTAAHLPDSLKRHQIRIYPLNKENEPLANASARYRDIHDAPRTVTDTSGENRIIISDAGPGHHLIKVTLDGYLGRYIKAESDSSSSDNDKPSIVSIPVTLYQLSSKISGHVFFKTPANPRAPRQNAVVTFVLDDSLFTPGRFSEITNSKGRFELDSVPPLAGQLYYYWDTSQTEPDSIRDITQKEVLESHEISAVVLEQSENNLTPLVESVPPDNINKTDSLVFKFNQPIASSSLKADIILVNSSLEVLFQDELGNGNQQLTLKYYKTESGWLIGKKYQYIIHATTITGQPFQLPGSSKENIEGYFYVKPPENPKKNLLFPHPAHIPVFNSGDTPVFDSTHLLSSYYADSTTRYALLEWTNPKETGDSVLADSLVVYIQDNDAIPGPSKWASIPARLPHFILDFSEFYKTWEMSNNKPVFPILESKDKIVKITVIPKHGNSLYHDKSQPIYVQRKMGPKIYVDYETDSLTTTPDSTGSVKVKFFLDADNRQPAEFVSGIDTSHIDKSQVKDYLNSKGWRWEWSKDKTGGTIFYTVNKSTGIRFKSFRLIIPLTAEVKIGDETLPNPWDMGRLTWWSFP